LQSEQTRKKSEKTKYGNCKAKQASPLKMILNYSIVFIHIGNKNILFSESLAYNMNA